MWRSCEEHWAGHCAGYCRSGCPHCSTDACVNAAIATFRAFPPRPRWRCTPLSWVGVLVAFVPEILSQLRTILALRPALLPVSLNYYIWTTASEAMMLPHANCTIGSLNTLPGLSHPSNHAAPLAANAVYSSRLGYSAGYSAG